MQSNYVIVELNTFTSLLEQLHICQSGFEARVRGIISTDDNQNIEFSCCNVSINIDKLSIITCPSDSPAKDIFTKESEYENVLFVNNTKEDNDPAENGNEFQSIFINIDENSTQRREEECSSPYKLSVTPKVDPLLVDNNQSENKSSHSDSSRTYLFKSYTKKLLPKVVDWSDNSIEPNSYTSEKGGRERYPTVFICEYCGEQFKGKDRVYKFFLHRNQVHTKKIKYSCPICSKVYWGEREYSAHVSSHVNKFVCEFCGLACKRKNELTRHLLIHKDKNFSCKFCGKKFRRKDHLCTHERIHTKNFIHKCKICGSGFAQNFQLTLHNKKCKESNTS